MKSTNFLRIDFISTVKLTQKESREIERILKSFDQLVFHLVKIGLLKLRPKSRTLTFIAKRGRISLHICVELSVIQLLT